MHGSQHTRTSLDSDLDRYEAMIEAADTELGRFFEGLGDADGDGLPDNTWVIVVGDNGTGSSGGSNPRSMGWITVFRR